MLWTIPPDSHAAIDRSPTPAVVGPSPGAMLCPGDETALIETTQHYLASLAAGRQPNLGHVSQWEKFYQAFATDIRRAAGRRSRSDKDDEAQEAWLVVLERIGSFRPDAALGSFRGWLAIVTRHHLVDRYRSAARRALPMAKDGDPRSFVDSGAGPADDCARADEQAWVAALLDRLRIEVSPLNFQVLHLRSIEELPVAEVASRLGVTPEQVRVRHHRMLGRLRRLAGLEDRNSEKF